MRIFHEGDGLNEKFDFFEQLEQKNGTPKS